MLLHVDECDTSTFPQLIELSIREKVPLFLDMKYTSHFELRSEVFEVLYVSTHLFVVWPMMSLALGTAVSC